MTSKTFRAALLVAVGTFLTLLALSSILGGEAMMGWPFWSASLVILASALVMLVAAIRAPPMATLAPAAAPEASPSEAFLRIAERAEDWIVRARRYLLMGGIATALVWLPIMAFGLFVSARGPDIPAMRIQALAGVVAFIAGGIRWWRRVREVDEELREWRVRIARLRGIERELLADP